MNPEDKRQPTRKSRPVTLAREVVTELSERDRVAVLTWARQLMVIRNAKVAPLRKAVAALRASSNRAVLGAVIKRTHGKLKKAGYRSKKLLWDDRNWAARLALGGVAAGVAAGGGAKAGLAALGGAIGVPLWLVTGSGAAFLGALVDELSKVLPERAEDVLDPKIKREIERLLENGESNSSLYLVRDGDSSETTSTT